MGDTHKDLERYLSVARSVERAAFVEQHPHPFLLRLTPGGTASENPWADDLAFSTQVGDFDGSDDSDDEDRPENSSIVVPVKKREGGPFPNRIGVGRARNCDVTLRFPSVSKLHAQFVIDDGVWTLVDLTSANGTELNGVRIKPRVRHPVQLGDRLKFGTVDVELLDAGTVYDRVKTVLG